MNLLDYIKGNKKGKEANRLEKEAMSNPFMYEAMEGFDNVNDDHEARLNELYTRFETDTNKTATKKRKMHPIMRIVASTAAAVAVVCTFFLLDGTSSDLLAKSNETGIIDIYVTDDYYSDNIAQIAQTNSVQIIKHRKQVNIPKFTIDENNTTLAQDVLEFDRKNTPVEVYAPTINDRSLALSQSRNAKTRKTVESLSGNMRSIAPAMGQLPSKPIDGYDAYQEYIKANIQYPTDDVCKRVLGSVVIEFSVDEKGRPYELKIVQALCESADEEALRLVERGPRWTQSTSRGTIRIDF